MDNGKVLFGNGLYEKIVSSKILYFSRKKRKNIYFDIQLIQVNQSCKLERVCG